ncbi:MAG: hypothetical protein HMLKMBBP_01356 [Planctomycetes bacterium]|nr:hypothetical protein [Planctomycetota bacterium]
MTWPPTKAFEPHPWQVQACDQWERAGCRGIVEAVTGSGKTWVGLEAIARLTARERSLDILIVVPTVPLLRQWESRLTTAFPGQRVGLIGEGHDDDYSKTVIACVAIVNSAVRRLPHLFSHVRRSGGRTLLIADECHHYAEAPVWSTLTQKWEFDYVLGLSATMGRYEAPGLGKIVYEYRFQDARRDDLVPAFDLVNVGVNLRPNEKDEYLRLTDAIMHQWQAVMDQFGRELEYVQADRFHAKLRQIMMRPGTDPALWDPTIKKYFILCFKRASVVYKAAAKLSLAQRLIRLLVGEGKKTLTFFERIESAEFAAEAIDRAVLAQLQHELRQGGPIWCKQYHSEMKHEERTKVLAEFKMAGPSALLACRALDEGLDIPEIDAAVLMASTQSERQRIQRIGRALRCGDGSKRPIIVTLYVVGTTDENVVGDDALLFKDVATIYSERGDAGYERVKGLLRRNSSVGPSSAGRAEVPTPPGSTVPTPTGAAVASGGASRDPEPQPTPNSPQKSHPQSAPPPSTRRCPRCNVRVAAHLQEMHDAVMHPLR